MSSHTLMWSVFKNFKKVGIIYYNFSCTLNLLNQTLRPPKIARNYLGLKEKIVPMRVGYLIKRSEIRSLVWIKIRMKRETNLSWSSLVVVQYRLLFLSPKKKGRYEIPRAGDFRTPATNFDFPLYFIPRLLLSLTSHLLCFYAWTEIFRALTSAGEIPVNRLIKSKLWLELLKLFIGEIKSRCWVSIYLNWQTANIWVDSSLIP